MTVIAFHKLDAKVQSGSAAGASDTGSVYDV